MLQSELIIKCGPVGKTFILSIIIKKVCSLLLVGTNRMRLKYWYRFCERKIQDRHKF